MHISTSVKCSITKAKLELEALTNFTFDLEGYDNTHFSLLSRGSFGCIIGIFGRHQIFWEHGHVWRYLLEFSKEFSDNQKRILLFRTN